MEKPVLVVMAAGMGSRYGGLKQMDPIGNNGEWIIDFSLYDAYIAGFRDVVFIIREEIVDDFKSTIGKRILGHYNVSYVVQRIEDIPDGFAVPEGRTKPWGTGHAVYSARNEIGNRNFMAINADDYYGPEAFRKIYDHLNQNNAEYAMVGYLLKNTVTPNGHVARGICSVGDDGLLKEVIERINIQVFEDGIKFSEDEGETWSFLPDDTPVSLNCWGFPASILKEMDEDFKKFLLNTLPSNPIKAEYFLPGVVENMIVDGKSVTRVLSSHDRWYGITYKADKQEVSEALDKMKAQGKYPFDLWD